MPKWILLILFSFSLAFLEGCTLPVISEYNAESDVVDCKQLDTGIPVDTWTELGYVCHVHPEQRLKPNRKEESPCQPKK